MNKVELEAKLESLTDEINFLRSIYEEVWHKINSVALFFSPLGFGTAKLRISCFISIIVVYQSSHVLMFMVSF